MHLSRTRSLVAAIAALFAVVLVASCSSPAPTERAITLTFIRHAESQANADGVHRHRSARAVADPGR